MLIKTYLFTGLAAIAFYGASAFNGWEFGNPTREKVDLGPDKRSSGWSRSYTPFWHSGYRGGK